MKLDLSLISDALLGRLNECFNKSSQTYHSRFTLYWGLFLPVFANNINDVKNRLPDECFAWDVQLPVTDELLERFYTGDGRSGVILTSQGKLVRAQCSKEYMKSIEDMCDPFIQVMVAYEKSVTPYVKTNPLIDIDRGMKLSLEQMATLIQAVQTSTSPELDAETVSESAYITNEQSDELFFLFPTREVLRNLSLNPNVYFLAPMIEQILNTSRRPLLEFNLKKDWLVLATVDKVYRSILRLNSLRYAELYSRWPVVANARDRSIIQSRDHILDFIADRTQRAS
jgi:hypothetical protein